MIQNTRHTDNFDIFRRKTNNTAAYEGSLDRSNVEISERLSGTLSATGLSVIGVGTSFSQEIAEGSMIAVLGSAEYRVVKKVVDDFTLELESAYSVDFVSQICVSRDLVSMINSVNSGNAEEDRRILIKAIAMS